MSPTISQVRLWQATTSSASWRVRIALALKSVTYESTWLDLGKADHLSDEYARIAPAQQVPCLEIDGLRIFQSVAIIEYLDETRPTPLLLPGDPAMRASVRSIAELINSGIQPLHNLAVRQRLHEQFGAMEAATTAWCRYWIERRFAALDRMLAQTRGTYACGDVITIADVLMYPQVMTAQRFGVDSADFPEIYGILGNLAGLAPFHGSHAPVA